MAKESVKVDKTDETKTVKTDISVATDDKGGVEIQAPQGADYSIEGIVRKVKETKGDGIDLIATDLIEIVELDNKNKAKIVEQEERIKELENTVKDKSEQIHKLFANSINASSAQNLQPRTSIKNPEESIVGWANTLGSR